MTTIIYSNAQIVPELALTSPCEQALVSFVHGPVMFGVPILDFSYPNPGSNHFSKKFQCL